MSKIAIIDIGSNSVRCLYVADGKTIYKETITARLGEGYIGSGKLTSVAMRRNVEVIKSVFYKAVTSGAENVYAFATAAVRNSSNGQDFVKLVKDETGITVTVLSGEDEAEIGLLGVLNGKDGTVIDIGGASAEIITSSGGKVVYSHSLPIGAVVMHDLFGNDREKLSKFLDEKIQEYGQVPNCESPYGIGGTATNLGFIKLGEEKYDRNKVNGTVVTLDELERTVDELYGLSIQERVEKFHIKPLRAEVIDCGALLMTKILKLLGAKEFTVSESDNTEGYLLRITENKRYEK